MEMEEVEKFNILSAGWYVVAFYTYHDNRTLYRLRPCSPLTSGDVAKHEEK